MLKIGKRDAEYFTLATIQQQNNAIRDSGIRSFSQWSGE